MPAPTKATPETLDAIVRHLRRGNYREVAARAVGVSERTFHAWMKRGRDNADAVERGQEELDDFGLFYCEVIRAEAEAETRICDGVIDLAGRLGKPEVLLKFLERRYPDRWGRRQLEIRKSTVDVVQEEAAARETLRERVAQKRARLEGASDVTH